MTIENKVKKAVWWVFHWSFFPRFKLKVLDYSKNKNLNWLELKFDRF